MHFLSSTMQSFVSPVQINVLSDRRIRMPEESRNLSDVELLFLEHVREEMPQRMMRDIGNFRFRACRLQRSSNLFTVNFDPQSIDPRIIYEINICPVAHRGQHTRSFGGTTSSQYSIPAGTMACTLRQNSRSQSPFGLPHSDPLAQDC